MQSFDSRGNATRLMAVSEEQVEAGAIAQQQPAMTSPPRPGKTESAIAQLLMMTLRTLPSRILIALADLTELAMIASAFVLWLLTIADPTPLQLSAVGGYAVFIVLILAVRRRRP